jgi:uracil permease
MGLVDFTTVAQASFFSMPAFKFPFVHYTPSFSAILTIAPIALVTMAEHIGDHTALSTIIGKDLLKDPGLDRTLLGDGLATFIAGAIGGPANTTYGENTSVVGMTKIASVWVIGLAAIIAIVLGFLGKFTAIVSTIPNPVLGGVSLLLYGFIAVNGLKVLIENQINFGVNKNIVVASTMLVLGLGGAAVSIVHGDLSLTISGMSLAAVIGILLNLLLRDPEAETKAEVKVEKASTLEKDVEELKADVKMLKAEIEKLKGNKQAPKEEAKEEPKEETKEENNGTNNNNNNQKKKKKHK